MENSPGCRGFALSSFDDPNRVPMHGAQTFESSSRTQAGSLGYPALWFVPEGQADSSQARRAWVAM